LCASICLYVVVTFLWVVFVWSSFCQSEIPRGFRLVFWVPLLFRLQHHISSNSFVIPRLYMFDMNHCIFSTIEFCSWDQIQVTPTNLVDIVQHLHCTGAIWETIRIHSQEHPTLLWSASQNVLVHDSNVGCKKN
jgi:hypothetical protein